MTDHRPPPGPSAPTPLIPAATVVLLRPSAGGGPEVLLTRRPSTMAFGPDIHVFPGGRVEATDEAGPSAPEAGLSADEAARHLGLGLAPDGGMTRGSALAHHVAAARETREETGIEVRPRDLIALTRWVTPVSMSRRFDVRFFAAFVPAGTEVVGDSHEVVDAVWLTPEDALRASVAGELALWQPTYVTLQQLVGSADASNVRAAFEPGSAIGGPSFVSVESFVTAVDTPWAGGIPGRRTRAWLVGKRDVVVVDPADPTGVTTDAIVAHVEAAGARLVGVLVTDLDPERHAGVEMLAHGLDLPVFAASDVAARAPYPVVTVGVDESVSVCDAPLSVASAATLASPRTTPG